MLKLLASSKDLVGKKVLAISSDGFMDLLVVVESESGEKSALAIKGDSPLLKVLKNEVFVCEQFSVGELASLGVITEEEGQLMRDQRLQRMKEQTERTERADYERLKAKYG